MIFPLSPQNTSLIWILFRLFLQFVSFLMKQSNMIYSKSDYRHMGWQSIVLFMPSCSYIFTDNISNPSFIDILLVQFDRVEQPRCVTECLGVVRDIIVTSLRASWLSALSIPSVVIDIISTKRSIYKWPKFHIFTLIIAQYCILMLFNILSFKRSQEILYQVICCAWH